MKSPFLMSMSYTTTDEPDLAIPDLNTNSSCESQKNEIYCICHERLLL